MFKTSNKRGKNNTDKKLNPIFVLLPGWFVATKGYPASSIHGDKTQREREDALRLFKTAATPILVATDVAARGLDINNVTQVRDVM